MGNNVYTEFLFRDGERVDLLPAIVERLLDRFDGTIVGDVDPQTAGSVIVELAGSADVEVDVVFEPGDEEGFFDWPRIELRCHITQLVDDEHDPDAPCCRAYVDAARETYLAPERRPALAYSYKLGQDFIEPPTGDQLSDRRQYLSWLDVFSPEEVDDLGRERVLSTPAPRVEGLEDGAVLVCSEHPLREEAVTQLADVSEHLGIPTWLDYHYS